jgi:uncharacterized protein
MSAAALSTGQKSTLVALGALIGCYSTLCGIGGGVFAVPLLHYVYRMPLRIAVANSLVLVAASTTSATLLEFLHPRSSLNGFVVAALIASSFVGTQLGYRAAQKLDVRKLKMVFCGLLVIVATEVLLNPTSLAGSAASATALTLSAREWIAIVLVGLVSGFVAPMLGIGGGLVAVPGLSYGVPALGYLGARACSMAMSMFTSWQSVWLYNREGSLRSATSLWLAGGALAGAAAGIQLVHVESVTKCAQALVAFALYFAAARFAWDLVLSRRAAQAADSE